MADYGTSKMSKELVMALFDTLGMEIDSGYNRSKLMADSTHRAEVVPVVLEKHPNADALSIVKIYDGGYQCIVRTEDWVGKDKGVYIQPDSLVPLIQPEFAFLADPQKPGAVFA